MVLRQIPNKILTFEQIGLPEDGRTDLPPPARHLPGHRPDRLGQDHHARRHDQLHQQELRPPHHHDRRPDRILPRAQEIDRRAARSRRRRAQLLRGPAPRPATRPRRDAGRRNARPGDHRRRHHRRRNRATWSSARCTPPAPPPPSTASSTPSRPISRNRSACSLPTT